MDKIPQKNIPKPSALPSDMVADRMPKCGECNLNASYYSCILCHMPYCNISCYYKHAGKKCLGKFLENTYAIMDETMEQAKTKKKSVLEEYHDLLNELFPKPILTKTRYSEKVRRLIEKIDVMPVSTEEEMLKKLDKDERRLYDSLMVYNYEKIEQAKYIPFWETEYLQVLPEHRDEVKRLSEVLGYKKGCPTYTIEGAPPLKTVTSVEPTPITFYNLCHLIAVYSVIVRYYSGEHVYPYARETSMQLIRITNTLVYSGYYTKKRKAVQDACKRLYMSAIMDIDKIVVEDVLKDVNRIVRGPNSDDGSFYILCVLGEIYEMFVQCNDCSPQRELRKQKFNGTTPVKSAAFIGTPGYDELTASASKIRYYYSYVQSYYSNDWYYEK